MPLEEPKLDARTFEDLLREARLRIPRYSREWTDFNDSDPGMVIVQLFAWFTEQMLFQLNRVPDRAYVAFLRMLNLEPRAAQPARALVTFTPSGGTTAKFVRARSRLPAADAEGNPVTFETMTGLDLVPHRLATVQVFNGADYEVVTAKNEQAGVGGRADDYYRPFGQFAQVGSALYLGFERHPDPARRFPDRIRLAVFLPPRTRKPNLGDPRGRPELVWEFIPRSDPTRWRRLDTESDETEGGTREGFVVISGPDDPAEVPLGKEKEKRYWIRCRVAAGGYPPDAAPLVASIRPNTVQVENLVTVTNEVLGTADGVTTKFTLLNRPVVPESLRLELELPGRDVEPWKRVESFFDPRIDENSPVYTLAATSGEVQFGDGRKGRIPEPGGTLVAAEYRAGGGKAGNVAVGAIATPPPDVDAVTVTNLRPAAGGEDEENADDARRRAPLYLRSRGRAVTAEDFKLLAERVPGVARAVVLENHHPDYPGATVPGCVTVVVIPFPDLARPDAAPTGDIDPVLGRAVRAELDRHRLITTELFVTGPRAKRVRVHVAVVRDPLATDQQTRDEVRKTVLTALRPHTTTLVQSCPADEGEEACGKTKACVFLGTLFGTVLAVTDPKSKLKLVRTVTKLRWEDDATNDLGQAIKLEPAEVIWCDAVEVEVRS